MKKVETYGLRMHGLRAACGATKDYGPYSGHSVEIIYNLETGEVSWSEYFTDTDWGNYYPGWLVICRVWHHMTMQAIADAIATAVAAKAA